MSGYKDAPDVRAEGYDGPKIFDVWHVRHGALLIAAPDETAALIEAAKIWGERWQKWAFYTSCIITRRG